MKIATVGKGGSGKTTLAGTLARLLASDAGPLLAIDGDPNPNLALTLGLTPEQADRVVSIPPGVMEIRDMADGQRRLVMTLSPDELLARYAVPAPGGISLIVMGKPPDGSAGSGCMCASHRAVRGLIEQMSAFGDHTVTDMEAGLEHLKRGTARHVDVMLIAAEPYYRSLEAAARTFSLARELRIPHVFVVANKVKDASDREAIRAFCELHGMPVIGSVVLEPAFVEAERIGRAPVDFAPQSDGVRGVREIAARLLELQHAAA
jgi:CO dehydrogenase maturation factor